MTLRFMIHWKERKTMDKIKAMLTLQQQLNDATNGIGWEQGRTQNGKTIDWRRCIWLEAAELVESYPWKHWKSIDSAPDYANIKIEAVDIWHFVMSEALRQFSVDGRGDIAALSTAMRTGEAYESFANGPIPEHGDPYQDIAEVERLVALLFAGAPIEEWTAQFYRVALLSGLDLDALYRLYVGKNILNRFRQDHGYKEGSYIKIWDGLEDNVVMQRLLEGPEAPSPEALYRRLEEAYPA